MKYGPICPTNDWKKCVHIALAEEKFLTRKIYKKLNCYHSTVLRVIKLKREIGDIERTNGYCSKKATTIVGDIDIYNPSKIIMQVHHI